MHNYVPILNRERLNFHPVAKGCRSYVPLLALFLYHKGQIIKEPAPAGIRNENNGRALFLCRLTEGNMVS